MRTSVGLLSVALVSVSLVAAGIAGCQGCSDPPPTLDQTLGVKIAPGVLVLEVDASSAAERAGLRTGDLIVSLNGKDVRHYLDLQGFVTALREHAMLDKAILELHRPDPDGETYSRAVAEIRIPAEPGSRTGFAAGLELVVLEVPARSPAERHGIRQWDFVERINGTECSKLRTVIEADKLASEAVARDGRVTLTLARWRPVATPSGVGRAATIRTVVLEDPRSLAAGLR